jgi:hypothetical protein
MTDGTTVVNADLSTAMREALRALAHEEFDRGRAQLEAIVAAAPTWAEAWALLSGAHLVRADVVAATAASERSLALAPGRFLPCLKAGELAMRLGDAERAEGLFLAALRATDPETADATAAKRWLAIARGTRRSGIAHHASLPSGGRLHRLVPSIRRGLPWRVPARRGDVGPEIT